MKKWSVGVIGTGFIGEAHIEALRRLGHVNVSAVAGSGLEETKKRAKQLGVPTAYGDWQQIVMSPDIDAIHICTPNHLHFPMAKAALEQGKHVICEKPLTFEIAEAQQLIDIATERSLVHAVHFNSRYYPMVQQAKAYMDNNEFGKIFSFQGHYLQDWLLFERDYNWRMDPKIGGKSRAIADIGSHLLDIAEYLIGSEISHVCAQTSIFHPVRLETSESTETFSKKDEPSENTREVPIETEDYAAVLLKFENGTVGNVTISQMAAGRKNQMAFELNGSEGSMAWNSENPNELWLGHRDDPNEILIKDPQLMKDGARHFASYPGGHAEGFPDTIKQLFRQVYGSMEDGTRGNNKRSYPTFEDGLREIVLREAIMKSAVENKWIQV